jgi:predicted regulator of Ras-like GTPase activity (Roadblock/LC7/MglB family)
MAEPFSEMLTSLVDRVDGAIGAAFVDSTGEAVQSHSLEGNTDLVDLMGAYQGIAFQTSRSIVSSLDAGAIDYFYTAYDRASFVIKALDQDYFLMLVLGPDANLGQGIYNVRRSAETFNREI